MFCHSVAKSSERTPALCMQPCRGCAPHKADAWRSLHWKTHSANLKASWSNYFRKQLFVPKCTKLILKQELWALLYTHPPRPAPISWGLSFEMSQGTGWPWRTVMQGMFGKAWLPRREHSRSVTWKLGYSFSRCSLIQGTQQPLSTLQEGRLKHWKLHTTGKLLRSTLLVDKTVYDKRRYHGFCSCLLFPSSSNVF